MSTSFSKLTYIIYNIYLFYYFQGSIYTVKVNSHQGTLSRSHRIKPSSKEKSEFTTIQYRSFSLMTQGPVLLALTRDGSLSFFRFFLIFNLVWFPKFKTFWYGDESRLLFLVFVVFLWSYKAIWLYGVRWSWPHGFIAFVLFFVRCFLLKKENI